MRAARCAKIFQRLQGEGFEPPVSGRPYGNLRFRIELPFADGPRMPRRGLGRQPDVGATRDEAPVVAATPAC
jgi:hypothetical protein